MNFVRSGCVVALCVGMATSASAMTLDFIDYIDGVSGETSGDPLNMGPTADVPIATTANGYTGNAVNGVTLGDAFVAYGDSNSAGLGVCEVTNGSGGYCNPSSDDNLQAGEILGLSFADTITILGVGFRGEHHPNDQFNQVPDVTDMFAYSVDGGANWSLGNLVKYDPLTNSGFYFFGAPLTIAQGSEILFGYNNQQYYVSALALVPVPAAGFLLLGGLGGLAAMRRRKKAA